MCQRITCKECGRPGFVGCGLHVEQVLGDVAAADRCQCGGAKKADAAPPAPPAKGILDWVTDFIGPRGGRNENDR